MTFSPAAADTIAAYFEDTGLSADDFDLIATGDLGSVGSELLMKLLREKNIDLKGKHRDCGLIIFDKEKQDVHAGGSGCGCSASVFTSYIYKRIKNGKYKRVLFMATGALMSTVSNQQSESIPSIAHLISISGGETA